MNTRLLFRCLALCCISYQITTAQETRPKRTYMAGICQKTDITIDGKLNEPVWENAEWQNNFIQYEPNEGSRPGQKTEIAVLLDENDIFVAFKAFDSSPDSIVQRMTRRDDVDGDLVAVQFDSYHDRRTAFSFMVSAAGIKKEYLISNDGENEDSSWDPIWWVKTSRDSLGWYAEMRIPLTQLRFEGNNEQTWGLQAGRLLFRKNETSLWQPASKKQSGWVSQFGELTGLKKLKARKVADFTPYAVARTDQFKKEPENPFRTTGKKSKLDFGIDGKVGLTNNLTLDFTVNPDFGQVEADPSEVNLTAFETFFAEKRPFFVEGKNILSFPLMFGDGDLASENLFYSRRIGRRPHYEPELNPGEYMEAPEFTNILGATKITGKTKDGWSVGLLESLTAKEYADISNGHKRQEMIEPLTNYAVGRIQKDFNNSNTILGGMLTAVNRNIEEKQLDYLHQSAYTGGIDFVHKWHNKDWEIDVSSYFSYVEGSAEAITNTQKSWIHNFQRPDATHVRLDTTRTSLLGQGGKFVFGKYGGNLKFMAAVAWKSPELELNDIGYMRSGDDIIEVFWMGYRFYKPFSIFRNLNLNFNQWLNWNFAGDLTGNGQNINVHTQFKNYWHLSMGGNLNWPEISTTQLRGGPSLKMPGSKNLWMYVESNEQKKITIESNLSLYGSNESNTRDISNIGLGVGYRPGRNLKVNIFTNWSTDKNELQYVTQQDYHDQTDYVFARINQKTLSTSLRLTYNITPDLSVQYWGQPFFSSGTYSRFKKITNGKAEAYYARFKYFPANELTYNATDETYRVYNTSGNELYRFDQPDFNVKEFLSNMVIRWEYSPGSTLFLVWSQNRDNSVCNGSFRLRNDFNTLFNEKAYNVFLIKLSYRIGR